MVGGLSSNVTDDMGGGVSGGAVESGVASVSVASLDCRPGGREVVVVGGVGRGQGREIGGRRGLVREGEKGRREGLVLIEEPWGGGACQRTDRGGAWWGWGIQGQGWSWRERRGKSN